MRFIRGATTVAEDCEAEIRLAVKELLDAVFQENGLTEEEVRCVVFSVTSDLHSYSPAKAARTAGYSSAPLFSCLEPEIEGGLPRCIRVMLGVERAPANDFANNHANGTENEPVQKHVYLRGAKILRKDVSEIYNIALDGPAGSGKSTVAKALAKKYGILYLDTGAMYRACALEALKTGIDGKDRADVEKMLETLSVDVEYKDGAQHTYLNGADVSEEIRTNEVSMAASDVSAHPAVRAKMVELQRKIAKNTSCVLDGRDIGSTVLPNARFKFFVTADCNVRAERRYKELIARGQSADLNEVLSQIVLRDKQDAEREFSPLKQADDAIVIDTSNLSIDEAVRSIDRLIQEKI